MRWQGSSLLGGQMRHRDGLRLDERMMLPAQADASRRTARLLEERNELLRSQQPEEAEPYTYEPFDPSPLSVPALAAFWTAEYRRLGIQIGPVGHQAPAR